MKFATFSSAAALAVALLAVSTHAGFPDEEANSHFIRRLPAGGNGQGRGQGNGNGGGGNGNGVGGKPGADDEIDVIVKWKNSGGRDELKNFAKDRKVKDVAPGRKIAAFKTSRVNFNSLKNNPNIETVEIDAEVHALPNFRGRHEESSNRRLQGETIPYGITMVRSAELPGNPTGQKKVCVVDTGYDITHEDLPKASDGVAGYTPIDYSPEVWSSDGHGHGTHCAGTIGAIGNNDVGVTSVNPDPSKFSFFIGKGLTDSGSGSTSSVLEAVDACRDNGADVISMSLGGGGPSTIANDLYESVYADNVLLIAAAGNDGNSALSYPASYEAVMSVAAVDSNENKASFSQYNAQVEIAGPGVAVESTLPGNTYASWSGTSMATPHVAGVAALVWGYFPDCTAPQIRNALVKTAKDKGTPGCDDQFGFGIVDAKAAYDLLATSGCSASGSSDVLNPIGGCARENLLSCSFDSDCTAPDPCTSATCEGVCVFEPISDCTYCGDGVCNADEDPYNCESDCPCADDPNCECNDDPEEWYDSDGPTYDCAWYGSDPSYCELYGDGYANNGITANMACCVCAGGANTPVGPPPPPGCLSDNDCDDQNNCTYNTCDLASGTCSNPPIPGCCSSNSDCGAGAPFCNIGSNECVQCLANSDCTDDGNPCTVTACSNNVCSSIAKAEGTSCSDGNFCNGEEICSGGSCISGAAPNCDDGIACTDDSCANNQCVNTPNNGLCDNGKFCDGIEICTSTGCQLGTPPDCGSGTCDEANDVCVVNPGCVDVTVEILTDYWGYETSWTISDASATTLMSGNAYDNQAYYAMAECLPDDASYVFTIHDSYGDGIYSPGYYKVSTDGGNNVLAEGGDFGSSHAEPFCLGAACPGPCNECVDSPVGWYDADGPYYDCAWYGSGSSFCSSYGNDYANFGTTANQACCACGGGESVCSTTVPSASSAFLASAEANARKKPNNGKKGGGAPKKKAAANDQCEKDTDCPKGSFCKGNRRCSFIK